MRPVGCSQGLHHAVQLSITGGLIGHHGLDHPRPLNDLRAVIEPQEILKDDGFPFHPAYFAHMGNDAAAVGQLLGLHNDIQRVRQILANDVDGRFW